MSRQLDKYLEGLIPDLGKTCLLLPLKPFSLGHLFLMKRYDCAYGSDDPDQMGTIGDLMQACLICSMTFEEFEDFKAGKVKYDGVIDKWCQKILDRVWLERTVIDWPKWTYPLLTKSFLLNHKVLPWVKLRFNTSFSERWLSKWERLLRKASRDKSFNMFDQFEYFNEYRKKGLYVPLYFREYATDTHRKCGAHWSQNIFEVLKAQLGYTTVEALNLPLARGLAEYYKLLETNGVITLMDDTSIEIVETGVQ